MKRKIATLDVYVDPESTMPGGIGVAGEGKYRLVITKGDDEVQVNSRRSFQTLLAHELGHFIALLTDDPTHNPDAKLYQAFTGDTSKVLPGERKAWELAHEMYPDVDLGLERKCLATYENDSWASHVPRTFEPIPSGLPMPTESAQEKRQRLLDIYWQAENAKLAHRAHVWEWSILTALFAVYWLAGLLTLGGAR